MLKFWRHGEQNDAIQVYYGRVGGGGQSHQSLGNFRNFWKKIATLMSFESHFERF